jgi:alkanesulfonate monooxygenase SsuD/methylene tetrahydromethanopterin reductase-like flavin-dependent oxidoreductase (luciferase family)
VPVSIWIAGTVPAAAERAGRIGDGWLTGQNATRSELAQQLEVYREAAARAGRAVLPVLGGDISVGVCEAEAEATVGRVLAEGYRGTGMEQLLVGGAKSVTEQLRSYRALGFEYVMVRHIVGEHDAMLRSFERIGQSLMPAIRDL